MTDNQITWQNGRVTSTSRVADGIARIDIATEIAYPAAPGAHVDIRTDTGDVRSYSIVTSADGGRHLTLGVRLSPTSRGGSRFMHGLVPGDPLVLTTPQQNFPLRLGAGKYVLLAGGIGITAVAAMAAVLRRVGADYRFVYVGRSRDAMAFVPELAALHGDRLELHIDAEGTGLEIPLFVEEIDAGTELYMCGPIRLMDAVRRRWEAAGLPVPNLRYETFGSSGWFDPEEFTVDVPVLGLEVAVGENETLLDALERAGADVMSDCRKGECGLCVVDIVDLHGTIDHRDVFFSEEQKSTSTKMCACVSRIVRDAIRGRPRAGAATLTLDLQ